MKFKQQPKISASKIVLAGLLSAGAMLPAPNPTVTQSVGRAMPAAITQRVPCAQEKAMPPVSPALSGQVLAILGGMGGNDHVVYGNSGLNRKDWGMSAACRRMVRKNRGIARGMSCQRL